MLAESEALRIVQREVQRLHISKQYSGSHVKICCPYHHETVPSCSIHIGHDSVVPIGYFHCFGCGVKGHWNQLAKTLDLEKIASHQFQGTRVGKVDLRSIKRKLFHTGTTLDDFAQYYGDGLLFTFKDPEWRRVTRATMQAVDAKVIFDSKEETTSLLLPVWVNGHLEGAVRARMRKKRGALSYVTSEGPWVKNKGLFPFDHVRTLIQDNKGIALVEGPRDALALIDKGIPALAVLGAKNWGREKRDLLLSLEAPKIVLAFDGDQAGVAASNDVWRSLKGLARVSVLKLKQASDELGRSVDPANMPREWRQKLRRKIAIR